MQTRPFSSFFLLLNRVTHHSSLLQFKEKVFFFFCDRRNVAKYVGATDFTDKELGIPTLAKISWPLKAYKFLNIRSLRKVVKRSIKKGRMLLKPYKLSKLLFAKTFFYSCLIKSVSMKPRYSRGLEFSKPRRFWVPVFLLDSFYRTGKFKRLDNIYSKRIKKKFERKKIRLEAPMFSYCGLTSTALFNIQSELTSEFTVYSDKTLIWRGKRTPVVWSTVIFWQKTFFFSTLNCFLTSRSCGYSAELAVWAFRIAVKWVFLVIGCYRHIRFKRFSLSPLWLKQNAVINNWEFEALFKKLDSDTPLRGWQQKPEGLRKLRCFTSNLYRFFRGKASKHHYRWLVWGNSRAAGHLQWGFGPELPGFISISKISGTIRRLFFCLYRYKFLQSYTDWQRKKAAMVHLERVYAALPMLKTGRGSMLEFGSITRFYKMYFFDSMRENFLAPIKKVNAIEKYFKYISLSSWYVFSINSSTDRFFRLFTVWWRYYLSLRRLFPSLNQKKVAFLKRLNKLMFRADFNLRDLKYMTQTNPVLRYQARRKDWIAGYNWKLRSVRVKRIMYAIRLPYYYFRLKPLKSSPALRKSGFVYFAPTLSMVKLFYFHLAVKLVWSLFRKFMWTVFYLTVDPGYEKLSVIHGVSLVSLWLQRNFLFWSKFIWKKIPLRVLFFKGRKMTLNVQAKSRFSSAYHEVNYKIGSVTLVPTLLNDSLPTIPDMPQKQFFLILSGLYRHF